MKGGVTFGWAELRAVYLIQSFQVSVSKMKQRLMRDNVGQIAVLEAVPASNEVCKCTIIMLFRLSKYGW